MPEPPVTAPCDILGLGQCSLDHLGIVAAYPPPDIKYEMDGMAIQGGGPAATALVALSRWGFRCRFAGVIGDDATGRAIAEGLRAEGVGTADLAVRPGCSSQWAFIAAEPAAGRRTIFWQRPTGAPLGPEEVDWRALTGARLFYTDGLYAEAALRGAREARAAGVPVMVDAGTLREGMLELAGLSDVFIASEPFARSLTGGDDPRGACRRLAELGPALAGVTLGRRGSVALAAGRWIDQGIHTPTRVVDTTGCGDLYHAGVAYGFLKGWPPERCLDLGAWAAAAVSGALGGRTGIPERAALEARYGGDGKGGT